MVLLGEAGGERAGAVFRWELHFLRAILALGVLIDVCLLIL